jgi:hypothetical protein
MKLAHAAAGTFTALAIALGAAVVPAGAASAAYVPPPEPVAIWQSKGPYLTSGSCSSIRNVYRNQGWDTTYCYKLSDGWWYFDMAVK